MKKTEEIVGKLPEQLRHHRSSQKVPPMIADLVQSSALNAEASCASAIATAKAVASEAGRSVSQGLRDLGNKSSKNSESAVHKTFGEFGLALDIPTVEVKVNGYDPFPCILFSDWLRFILHLSSTLWQVCFLGVCLCSHFAFVSFGNFSNSAPSDPRKTGNWHQLAGVAERDMTAVESQLQLFWDRFRVCRPSHMIFKASDAGQVVLNRTLPFLIHGDEGRGKKSRACLLSTRTQS